MLQAGSLLRMAASGASAHWLFCEPDSKTEASGEVKLSESAGYCGGFDFCRDNTPDRKGPKEFECRHSGPKCQRYGIPHTKRDGGSVSELYAGCQHGGQ